MRRSLFVLFFEFVFLLPLSVADTGAHEAPLPSNVYLVNIDRTGQYMYALQSLGSSDTFLFYSHDSGLNWITANLTLGNNYDMGISADGQTVAVVGTSSSESSTWVSTDAALTWTLSAGMNPFTVSVSPSGSAILTTKISHADETNGCMSLSSDNGNLWTTIGPDIASYTCEDGAVDSTGQVIVVAVSGVGLFTSQDAGATWENTYPYILDGAFLTYASGSFYAALNMPYTTLLQSSDAGMTWVVSDGPGNAENEDDSGVDSLSACNGGETLYLTTYHTLVSKDGGVSFEVQIDKLSTSVAVNEDATWGIWSCGFPANQKVYYGDIAAVGPGCADESSSDTSSDNDDENDVSMGVIIGIIAGLIILVIVCAIGVGWWFGVGCFKNNRRGESTKEERLI